MSIIFKQSDFNLDKVKKLCAFGEQKLKFKYWIYGLGDFNSNPPVKIEHNFEIFKEGGQKSIYKFFKGNGIAVQFEDNKKDDYINIGLRKDVREDVSVSAAIVKTLIQFNEGLIDLNEKPEKLVGIPK